MRERDESRVFVVTDEGTVSKREVTIGFSEDNNVEVAAGLQEGESVVTVGQEGLNEGYPVTVLEWEDGEGAPAQPAPTQRAARQGTSPGQSAADHTPAAQSDRPTQRAEAGQSGQAPSAGARGGRPGGGGRGMDPERMKGFLSSMAERNPLVKEAYQAELRKDPDFINDPEKLRAFMQRVRSEFGRGRQ